MRYPYVPPTPTPHPSDSPDDMLGRSARLLHDALTTTSADDPAIHFGDRTLTFGDLAYRARRLGESVAAVVPEAGTAAVVGHNHPDYVALLMGVPASGRSILLLNQRSSAIEWRRSIDQVGARLVLGTAAFLDRLDPPNRVSHVVDLDIESVARRFESLGRHPDPRPQSDPSKPAWLIPTSGTTGDPKLATLTHRSIWAAIDALDGGRPIADDDVYVFPFPLCHVAAYNVIAHLNRGRPVVLMERFDPDELVAAVARHQATSVSLAPTMLRALLDRVAARPELAAGLSSLRKIGYGAAPLSPELARSAVETLGVELNQGYGMTELSGNAVFMDAVDHRRAMSDRPELASAAGKPAPGVEIRISELGEIEVRAAQIFAGYHGDPDATEAVIDDGWLRTGDVGRIDADGYLYVTDRLRDVIITGGETVGSREIEDLLAADPTVAEVAVIGLPDSFWGEVITAVIVPTKPERDEVDPSALAERVRSRLGGVKTPRRWEIVDALPTSPTGKVLKRVLREQLRTVEVEEGHRATASNC